MGTEGDFASLRRAQSFIRFYLGCENEDTKKSIEEAIKGTHFESILDNVDLSLDINLPLIG